MESLASASNRVALLNNFILGKVTLNSCPKHTDVTGVQDNTISRINTLSNNRSTIFDKNFKDGKGGITRGISKFKIFDCSVSTTLRQLGYCIKIDV